MRYCILMVYLIAVSLICKAQDPHFSQYFASPLTINPANTGFFDGDARIALNERQQWFNMGYSHNTTSLSADVKLLKQRLPIYDVFALGLSGMFEQSLNGALQSSYISISGSYHKSLAEEGRQTLGLGIQINGTNKIIDYSKLSFASQFNGTIFDRNVSVDVPYSNNSASYLDVNAGLLYAFHSEYVNLYTGTSLYHISKPVESLFGTNDVIPMRKTIHGGGDITVSPISSILFSGFYMNQGGINDYMYGGAYGLKTTANNESFNIYLGLWYRQNSFVIPYLGGEYKGFNLGINYNTQSADQQYVYTPNTIEVSLIYKIKRNYGATELCPRF
jgi:type IX secretion system PorP/SprF family membrane protein